ncbi:MAG: hypothetical protein HQK51_03885, partial [Oligoflexia bacterium]|nr:hypothetical protein [Oligoflexia bacterium]
MSRSQKIFKAKKILKWFIIFFLTTIFLFIFITIIIFYFPQIIGHRPIPDKIVNSLLPADYKVYYQKFYLDLSATSFFEKNITLNFNDFCFFQQKGVLELCFKKIHIPMKIKFYSMQIDLLDIGEAELLGGKIFYKLITTKEGQKEKEKEKEEDSLENKIKQFETLFNKTIIKSLKIAFDKIEIESERKIYDGKLDFYMEMPKDSLKMSLRGEKWQGPGLEGKNNNIQFNIASLYSGENKHSGENKRLPIKFTLDSNITLIAGKKVNLSLQSSTKNFKEKILPLEIIAKVNLYSINQNIESQGTITLNEKAIKGLIQIEVQIPFSTLLMKTTKPSSNIKNKNKNKNEKYNISIRECLFSYTYGDFKYLITSQGEIKLDCKMKGKSNAFFFDKNKNKLFLPIIDSEVSLKMEIKNVEKIINGQLKARILPFNSKLLQGQGLVEIKFNNQLDKLTQGEGLEGNGNLKIRFKDFQVVQTILNNNNQKFFIPAPLHILRGPFDIELQGKIFKDHFLSLLFNVKTDLAAENEV